MFKFKYSEASQEISLGLLSKTYTKRKVHASQQNVHKAQSTHFTAKRTQRTKYTLHSKTYTKHKVHTSQQNVHKAQSTHFTAEVLLRH